MLNAGHMPTLTTVSLRVQGVSRVDLAIYAESQTTGTDAAEFEVFL